MNDVERLLAAEAIRQLKSRYFRGVDTGDGELVRSVLADDCVLDYMGCCTDPKTGRDYLPVMNVVLRGRTAWPVGSSSLSRMVSVHHGCNADITFSSDTEASAVWAMTDRLYMPPGAPFSLLVGHGYYHESYVKTGGDWKIRTIRIQRIRVEAS